MKPSVRFALGALAILSFLYGLLLLPLVDRFVSLANRPAGRWGAGARSRQDVGGGPDAGQAARSVPRDEAGVGTAQGGTTGMLEGTSWAVKLALMAAVVSLVTRL